MTPRQLIRLFDSRKPEQFDDQKTPPEIAASESDAQNMQEFIQYVLAQIRQITGKPKWYDEVPDNLENLTVLTQAPAYLDANCLASDDVGDCVYATANAVGGIYQVTKVDPTVYATPAAFGVIQEKSSATDCKVQLRGALVDVYTGLSVGERLFVDVDGALTHTIPTPAPGGFVTVQAMGTAISENTVLLAPSMQLTRRRG